MTEPPATVPTVAYATPAADQPLARTTIGRRLTGPTDVRISIEFCGVCHSDLHTARGEWPGSRYPCVPGHEIVGTVSEVGGDVTRHRVGDRVGVGVLIDSCGECEECRAGLENYCRRGSTLTYNSRDKVLGGHTFGGYSAEIVVKERYVHRLPDGMDPASAAPILCAGITVYSPLRHHRAGPGTKVAVVGFGGLGGMAVKLAKALGAEVTVISRSADKEAQARLVGADHYLVSADRAQLAKASRSFDLILSTIPRDHDLQPYLLLLRRDGVYVVLGAVEPLTSPIHGGLVSANRISITGSMVGGMPETQELLDFCAEHGITADVQVIGIDDVNKAYDQLAAGDPGFRYVIDLATLGA